MWRSARYHSIRLLDEIRLRGRVTWCSFPLAKCGLQHLLDSVGKHEAHLMAYVFW